MAAKCSDISQMILVDGQNTLNSEAMQSAFDFYDTLVKEAASIRTLFPSRLRKHVRCLHRIRRHLSFRVHGVSPHGARITRIWIFFGVMALPAPDDGMKGKLPYIGAQPRMGISANCKHPDVAAKYLTALYSEDYQAGLVEDGGFYR